MTGFNYLRARDYDPATGQFLQVDPAVDATHQPYAYVAGDPLASVDPTGLCPGSTTNPGPGHCTPEDFGANSPLLTPLGNAIVRSKFGDWLAGVLTHGFTGEATNFAIGLGDGASFHLSMLLRNLYSPGSECFVTKDGFYKAGEITGMVATTIATSGVGRAAAPVAEAGMASARATGQTGEVLAGIIKNTTRIPSATGSAAYRIPDALSGTAIGEVKNVAQLSYTNQLRDFAAFAGENNLTFNLYVRGGTKLTSPLQQAVDSGIINLIRSLP